MSHQLKLCTWKELKEVYGIPYCRMHIRRLELKGRFPQRIPLGECRVAWLAHEVEQWHCQVEALQPRLGATQLGLMPR